MALSIKPTPGTYSLNTGNAYKPKHLWMFDAGTGTIQSDIGTGTALNATIVNTDQWSSDGTIGSFINCSKATGVERYAYSATGNVAANTLLIVAIVKSNTSVCANNQQIAIACRSGSGTSGPMWGCRFEADEGIRPQMFDNANTVLGISVSGAYNQQWHMIAYKVTSGSVASSLDGAAWVASTGTYTFPKATGTGPDRYSFGAKADATPDTFFDGKIAAVWVYEDADYTTWNDAWIAALYANPWQFLTTSAVPGFSVSPSVTSKTNTTFTVGFTTDSSCTIYGVAVKAGNTAPSIAQIKAGQNASGTTAKANNSKSVNGANTLTLTPSDSPKAPRYDLYFVLNNGGGDSSRISLTNQYLNPATGKTFSTLTSVDNTSPFFGTGTAASDTVVFDSITTPDGYAVTCDVDGTVSFPSNGDRARQIINVDVHDYSADAYLGAGALIFNNLGPNSNANLFTTTIVFQKNAAIEPIAFGDYIIDPENDTLTVTAANSLPTGLSIANSELTGTPTTYGYTNTQIQWADPYNSIYSEVIKFNIGDLVPNVVGNVQATAVSTITGIASFTANVVTISSPNVSTGAVVSTDPTAGTLIKSNDVVTLYVANGTSLTITTTTLPIAIKNQGYYAKILADGNVSTWNVVSGTLPTGLSLDSANGEITGIPTVIDTYSFTVTANNGTSTNTKTLSIVTNYGKLGFIKISAIPIGNGSITTKFKNGDLGGTPVFRGTPPVLAFIANVGGTYNFGQHGSDPEGNTVTYSLQGNTYTGISMNSSTGLLTVANTTPIGTKNLVLRITDSTALYSEVNCSVTVASSNRPPLFTNAPAILSYTANTGGSYNFGQHGSDPDSDPVTYSLQGNTYTGISMNSSTGVLTVGTNAVAATRELVIRITDSGSLYSETNCAVTIVSDVVVDPPNGSPVFTNAPNVLSFTKGTGGTYDFGQHGSDPDSDPVTYSLEGTAYAGITIDPSTGVLTVGTNAVAATRSLTIRITDSGSLYSEHVCVVTIVSPPSGTADFIIPSNIVAWNADQAQPKRTGGTAIPNEIPGCIVELSAGPSTTSAIAGTRGNLVINNPRGAVGNPMIIRNPSAGQVVLSGASDFILLLFAPKNVLLDGSNGGQTYGIKCEFTTPKNILLKIKGIWENIHIKNIEMDAKATVFTGPGGIGFNPNDATTDWGKGVFKSGLIIENCYIHRCRGEGMYIGANYLDYEPPLKNVTIRNNIIEYCGRDGINGKQIWEGTNSIYGNKITNVGLNNPEETGQCHGITIVGPAYIYNNYLENVGEHGILIGTNDGPIENVAVGPASDLLAANGGKYSYGPYSTWTARIYNNVVINAGNNTNTGIVGSGIQMSGDVGTVLPTAYVYNNTVVNCRGKGVNFARVKGGWIRNNVLINNTGGAYSVGAGSQQYNKTTGSLTTSYKLTAEDAAVGTLGTDISYTDLNSTNPADVGQSRSGVSSKGAYEFS